MKRVDASALNHFRVGEWLVRPAENLLIRGEITRSLEPRVMDLLVTLALADGAVLAVDELLVRCWGGTFYGDAPVHRAVAQLRRAVGDAPAQSSFVATVRKRGYRLLPPIQFPDGYARSGQGPRSTWVNGSPFRGLEAFRREHAAVFFGRTRAIANVIHALHEQQQRGVAFVMCVGASGAGKSSLLEAGVVPRLLDAGEDQWRAVAACSCSMVGPDPIDALARALVGARVSGRPLYVDAELDALRSRLREDPAEVAANLGERLQRAQMRPLARGGLVVVVDELEGLHRDGVDPSAITAALAAFATGPACAILCACRSDTYGRLGELPALLDMKGSAGHVDVASPSALELAEILREPTALAGLRFERDAVTGERLDDVLRESAFQYPECLPMLQHALAELYEQRSADGVLTFASYRALGGLSGALAGRAETLFLSLDAATQAALPGLLGQAVLFSESDTIPRSQPVPTAALSPLEIRLSESLVAARLFVSATSAGRSVVRPAHDALLRHWQRAYEWIENNRALLGVRARAREAAARWLSNQRASDLLLTSGVAVEEGRLLLSSGLLRADSATVDFITACTARAHRLAWIRRGSLALLVVLAIGATSASWFAWRAERLVELQRSEAEHLVGFVVDDLSRNLQPLGRLDILDRTIAAVTTYLDGSSRTRTNDQTVRYRAETLLQLADIRVRQGKDEEALGLAQDARRLLSEGISSAADAVVIGKALGAAEYWIGYANYRMRRMDDAQAAWRRYAEHAAAVLQATPDDADALLEHSYALNNLAVLGRDRGDVREAARLFAESSALKRRVLAKQPDNRIVEAELADSESWEATTQAAVAEFASARQTLQDSMERVGKIRREAPDETLWMYRDATLRMNLALLESDQGQLAAAHASLEEAADLLRRLARIDATNQDWRRDALFVRQELAWTAWRSTHASTAAAELGDVAHELGLLREANPKNAAWRRLGAVIEERLARILLADARSDAEAAARAALTLIGQASIPGEQRGDARVRISVLRTLGDTVRARDAREASETWKAASSLLQPMLSSGEIALVAMQAALAERLHEDAAGDAARATVIARNYQGAP